MGLPSGSKARELVLRAPKKSMNTWSSSSIRWVLQPPPFQRASLIKPSESPVF